MVEKILNNTTPYGKIWASHEGSLHSSTLIACPPHAVGRGFASRPGHTKDHNKNGANCHPACHVCVTIGV